MTVRRNRLLKFAGIALCATLLLPVASLGHAVAPASAADGRGLGKSVAVGVASDNANISNTVKVDIVPSEKYPGTVRIQRTDNERCLATNGGKNDNREHGVQWTGCNNDASKNWVIEPVDTTDGNSDNTQAAVNIKASNEAPRFILRSWKYPRHCLFSQGNGLDGKSADSGRARGVTPNCGSTDTSQNKAMHFSIPSDRSSLTEWEFLRGRMVAGAVALHSRATGKNFAGENLWMKPFSTSGEEVGDARQATADGYFLPEAIAIDPAKEGAVVSSTAVTRDCLASEWWWGIDNSRGSTTTTESVTTTKQRTDELSLGVDYETEFSREDKITGVKVGVKLTSSVHHSSSDSTTESRTVTLQVPAGKWGMTVVTTEGITALGNWKTGSALNRTWKFDGSATVALKDSAGKPTTLVSTITSTDRKSCSAAPATTIEPGAPFRVVTPEGRLAPIVGDTVSADVSFIAPATDSKLDIRYQWFADEMPIVGQTGRNYTVTTDVLGKQLSFSAYENGGSKRYESELHYSQQTSAVQAGLAETSGTTLLRATPINLSEGIAGRPFSVALENTDHFGDDLELQNTDAVAGLQYDPETGVLSGTPATPGVYELILLDSANTTHVVSLDVDAEPTVFPTRSGISARVGDSLRVPLVSQAGTDASYQVEFLTREGDPTEMPSGLDVIVDEAGVPVIVGAADHGGAYLVRVTEASPHHDPGDARATVYEMNLEISNSSIITLPENDTVSLPVGVVAEARLAQIPSGGEAIDITGELPPGLTYDPATGSLTGTPGVAGSWVVTLGASSTGETQTLTIEVYDAPEVSFTRLAGAQEEEDGAEGNSTDDASTLLRVGEYASWAVHATNATGLSASVHRQGSAEEVDWATTSVILADELEVDALPTEPGDYVIKVSAENLAGKSYEELHFTVVAEDAGSDDAGAGAGGDADTDADGSDGDGGNGDGSGNQSKDPGTDARDSTTLPNTGDGLNPASITVIVSASAVALALGAWLMLRARRNDEASER